MNIKEYKIAISKLNQIINNLPDDFPSPEIDIDYTYDNCIYMYWDYTTVIIYGKESNSLTARGDKEFLEKYIYEIK